MGGGDDAAYFMRRVKQNGGETTYFIIGSDLPDGHHTTHFDVAEKDMVNAIEVCAHLLADTLRPTNKDT